MFLLCVTIAAQSTAISSEHQQHRSTDHCCLLCHVGPLPFLHTGVAVTVTPVLAVAWIAHQSESESDDDGILVTGSSRAPPSA